MPDFDYIGYEVIDEGRIAIITLDRPKQRNAQNRGMLVELGAAFELAEADDEVRVVLLRAAGPSFSAGHDLGSSDDVRERTPGPDQHPTYQCNGGTFGGVESRNRQEWHYFFENTKRWRNLRKITVAEVHGMVLSAGLMLAWCCDLIVAGEDTVFADVVGTRLGMCGVEYFGHPWEFGPRKAKELLLTGDSLGADEAHAIGMVSKVFPNDELADHTVEFARRIAKLPTVAALLIKESVNQTVDAMGFSTALDACFKIHQLNHAHWAEVTGGALSYGTVEYGLDDWRIAPEILPAAKATALTAMDVEYPPEAEAFRTRIRAFLAEHLPARWSGGGALPPDERRSFARQWRRMLADRGLVAVSWPKEYGGAGLSVIEQVVLAEEFARAGAPEPAENDLLGIELLGNTLIALGSEDQKRHFPPAHSVRRGPLVPGLLRARGGLGPGLRADQGRARRRRVGGQRAEDLDVRRSHRELDLRLDPHGPGRAQAQGPFAATGADGPAGRRGPSDRQRGRARLVQRGLPHRRSYAGRQRGRRGGWRLADRDDPARLRARICRSPRRPSTSAGILTRLHELAEGPGTAHRPAHPR